MEIIEPRPAAPSPLQQPNPKKKRSGFRSILILILLAVLGYLAYYVINIFVSPDRNMQQIYLIPRDAAIIIQTNDPINDWKKFSKSNPWQTLKKAPSFASIARNVNTLDSIMQQNDQLLSLTGSRELMISLHKTQSNDWDFLIVVDLQKVSKVGVLKDQIENIFSMMNYRVTSRDYNGTTITESRDVKTNDILYTAFLNNHFIVSYTSRLIEASIDESKQPHIGRDISFIEVEKLVANKGLSRIYVNYSFLPQFLNIYMGKNEYVDMLCNSLTYAGLYMTSESDRMEIAGNMIMNDNPDPYVAALINAGKQQMKAQEIMSGRTAFYTNLGFENTTSFVKELEKALSEKSKEDFDTYASSKKKLENFLGISMETNFLGWMAGEFALSQSEPGLLGREPELILAIKATNIADAKNHMDFIEKKIKRRTPINVKTIKYHEYDIKYIELKGFFRLFFGKMFDKFEKPYYTYIEDFVVFSNKPSSLLSFIADYEQKNLLKDSPGFAAAFSNVESKSTIFVYTDIHKFYYQLPPLLSRETWTSVQQNKDVLFSFPQWTFQVVADKRIGMQLTLHYKQFTPEPIVIENEDIEETVIASDSLSSDGGGVALEVVSESAELDELKRFYVEKFHGNILRDYYDNGAMKSESEIKNGKRNGGYKEYYESGKLKVRGNYRDNKPKSIWRYYSETGKVERKVKY